MEASLEDRENHKDISIDGRELKITYPLLHCLRGLKEKHNTISKIHNERFEQINSKRSQICRINCTNRLQSLSWL